VDLDRIEISDDDFFQKVRDGYKFLAKNEERFITIDGLKSIMEINKEILEIIEQFNR
jgi:thymidylate kinase